MSTREPAAYGAQDGAQHAWPRVSPGCARILQGQNKRCSAGRRNIYDPAYSDRAASARSVQVSDLERIRNRK
eukprot:6192031-Pleurochrysis_carterae.AAC.6